MGYSRPESGDRVMEKGDWGLLRPFEQRRRDEEGRENGGECGRGERDAEEKAVERRRHGVDDDTTRANSG